MKCIRGITYTNVLSIIACKLPSITQDYTVYLISVIRQRFLRTGLRVKPKLWEIMDKYSAFLRHSVCSDAEDIKPKTKGMRHEIIPSGSFPILDRALEPRAAVNNAGKCI